MAVRSEKDRGKTNLQFCERTDERYQCCKKVIEINYNNGLGGRRIYKIKVIKCIIYGCNSFELLKGMISRLEVRCKSN